MTDEQKEFAKKVNMDKAKNKTIQPILFIILSLLTYIEPLIDGKFDFGIFFEITSFVFLLIARYYMSQYEVKKAKRYLLCAIVVVSLILIYDILFFCIAIEYFAYLILIGYVYVFAEIFLISYLVSLFSIKKILEKASNPIQYKESTDWFYER